MTGPVINYMPLSFQIGKETTNTAEVEVQKPGASWDTGGMTLEEVGTEKPETRLGSLSSQTAAVHQEESPAATRRYA